MLTVLSHAGLGDIVAVVTRYFGGIKLGTGGLVRAYGGTVAQALNELASREKVYYRTLTIACDYSFLSVVEHSLAEFAGHSLGADYGAAVSLRLAVPDTNLAAFVETLRNRTQDRVRCELEDLL